MSQTVFVTGATGYIAKHLVLQLLNAGFNVIGSTRSAERDAELRAAVSPHLEAADGLETRLRTVTLDLTRDEGWTEALSGADVLMHTASPFPLSQPKDENDLITPAVQGTLRALKAADASGIKRVILTSSTVAVASGPTPARGHYTEDDWSDLTHPMTNAYAKSKTMAERAAWDFIAADAPHMQLTTINPGLVLGAPLDENFGTSIQLIERLMKGRDPMVPNFGFAAVDVKDVAAMHISALKAPEAAGERILAVAGSLWFKDIAETLAAAYPDRKIPTRTAPSFLMRALGLFDPAVRSILPQLGQCPKISNEKAKTLLGMEFRSMDDAIRSSAAFLMSKKLLR
ncbi:MAG: aldehyde reductase [Pseudomonadota bacterium]